MKAIIAALACVLATQSVSNGVEVPLAGPDETRDFEAGLFNRVFIGANEAIWPRPDILQRAVPEEKLPRNVVDRVRQTLLNTMAPGTFDLKDITLFGIPDLRWKWDYVLTEFKNKNGISVRLQSIDGTAAFTFHAEDLLKAGARTDEQRLAEALKGILNIPNGEWASATITSRIVAVAGQEVRHGLISFPVASETIRARKWFSELGYWCRTDEIFVWYVVADWASGEVPHERPMWDFSPAPTTMPQIQSDSAK